MAMSKDEFLSRMERVLAPLAPHERIDILGDYVEHFRAGEESGKTAEEIAEALGDPEELARTYLEQRESESTAIPPASAAGTGVIPPMPSIGGTGRSAGADECSAVYLAGRCTACLYVAGGVGFRCGYAASCTAGASCAACRAGWRDGPQSGAGHHLGDPV